VSDVVLRPREGPAITLDVGRWRAEADALEQELVDVLPDTVLDVGCGPGRFVEAVAASGRRALGIDPSPAAAAEAALRGCAVLQRSVFEPLPGEGRWGAAVLLDGNIGIGGDPVALLRRLHDLVHPGGLVVAEVEGPGVDTSRLEVRVESDDADGDPGPWFPWARVGVDGVATAMADAGLVLARVEDRGGRWLAHGRRP
jgi:SAM-dependent methyltransferase